MLIFNFEIPSRNFLDGIKFFTMKQIIFFLLMVFINSTVCSQESFKPHTKIDYDITVNNVSQYTIKGELFFDNDKSFFRYKPQRSSDIVKVKDTEQFSSYETNVHVVKVDTVEKSVVLDRINDQLIESLVDYNTDQLVNVKDDIPKLQWKLLSESKKIQSFSCSKATIIIDNEEFIAWYTSEIPSFFGPFKFGQLPGLIIELYSKNYSFYVVASNIVYPYKKTISMDNSKFEMITKKEYKLRNDEFLKKYEKELNEKITRVLTKTKRGVNISNVKIETKKN